MCAHKPPDVLDYFSELIPDKLYFGGYPTDEQLQWMEEQKFTHIVDLTYTGEMEPYNTSMIICRFAIPDHSVPHDVIGYCAFVSELRRIVLIPETKVFIHCRGGHGRSTMASVSLWILLHPHLSMSAVIDHVSTVHSRRVVMREKWRSRRVPFNHTQSSFLHKVHRTIFLNTTAVHLSATFSPHYNWVLPRYLENVYHQMCIDNDQTVESMFAIVAALINHHYETHRDNQCRLQLTFLRMFHFVDVPARLNEWVNQILIQTREKLFTV